MTSNQKQQKKNGQDLGQEEEGISFPSKPSEGGKPPKPKKIFLEKNGWKLI